MFETTLDPDTTPEWFINFFITFQSKVDLDRLKEHKVAFVKEKLSDKVEVQAASVLNNETEDVYVIARRTIYDDPIEPEISTYLFKTSIDKLHGKSVKTERKEIEELGIFYEAWVPKEKKKFPITKAHIGSPVCLAEDHRSKKYILLDIHEPGEKYYPDGGYEVSHPDFQFPQSYFFDAIKAFPVPKKRRKKKNKNTTKRKKRSPKKTKNKK